MNLTRTATGRVSQHGRRYHPTLRARVEQAAARGHTLDKIATLHHVTDTYVDAVLAAMDAARDEAS